MELDELVQENAALEQDLAKITAEKEFMQGESEKLKKGIEEMQGMFFMLLDVQSNAG